MRISTLILGIVMFGFIAVTLVTSAINFEQNYGIPYNVITNDTAGNSPNSINSTISAFNIQAQQAQQLDMNATSYAPGQPNGQSQPGANVGAGMQQSGLTTALQYVNVLLTLPKAIFITLFGYVGLGNLGITLGIMVTIAVILFAASMIFFRPL